MADKSFVTALWNSVIGNISNAHSNNLDPYRFPDALRGQHRDLRRRIKDVLLKSARHAGFIRAFTGDQESMSHNMGEVLRRVDGLGELYRSLADEDSRRVLVAVLAFWGLGSHKVKLPLNEPPYWANARRIDNELLCERHTVPIDTLDGHLNLYDLATEEVPVRLHAHRLNVLNTFLLEQYRYSKGGTSIGAKPGDVVIDGGGCWGDTALYFAHRVRPTGKVICFEFAPDNVAILRTNLELNPHLTSCVTVVDKALWDRSGQHLSFDCAGPGTSLARNGHRDGLSIETMTIDDYVAHNNIERVDLIKLDVEGAELKTLQGAQQTITRMRPSLAISLYHSLDDFVAIPAFLKSLDFTYELFLDHFTIHREETVLFARPTVRH